MRDYDQHCRVHEGTMDRTPERDSDNQLMFVAVGTNAPTRRIDFEEDSHFSSMSWDQMLMVTTDLQESGHSAELRDSPAATLALDDNPTASSSSVAASTVDQVSRAPKLDLKERSISATYKYLQYFSEWFGTGTKTVDTDLEEQILMLKETQIKYTELLKLAEQMMQHFQRMTNSQRDLAAAFADLEMKSPESAELQYELNNSVETQRSLIMNGEILLGALSFFISNLTTLVHTTMEDSIVTVKAYGSARLEYDAYLTHLESLPLAKHQHDIHKEKFDKLRTTLTIKLGFLEENKVKVMQKQLLLFQNATSAYFSGDKQALENCVKTFHFKIPRE